MKEPETQYSLLSGGSDRVSQIAVNELNTAKTKRAGQHCQLFLSHNRIVKKIAIITIQKYNYIKNY